MDISSSRGSSSLTRGGGSSLKKSSRVKKSTSVKNSARQGPGKTNSNGPTDKVSLSRDAKGTPKHKAIPDFSRWDSYVATRPGTPSASAAPGGPRSEAAASAASGGYDARFRKAASEMVDFSSASRETSAAYGLDKGAADSYRSRAVSLRRAEADAAAASGPRSEAAASAASGGYDARFRTAASEIGDFSSASRETSAAHAIDPAAAAGYRDRAVGFKRAETHADEFASAAPGIRARASAASEAAQTAREVERESALSSSAESDARRKYRNSFTRSTEPRSLWARTVPETFH